MTASPEPAAHDEQLHAVIAEYHRRLDRGEAPDRAAFIAAHGEFLAELESYFQSVDSVERLAGPALATAHAGDATEATMLTQPGRTIEEIVATPASDQSPADSAAKSDTQSVVAGETIITTMDEGTVSAISGLSGGKAAAPLQRFGRYRIVKELGRGAMGAVYLAHDEQLDREVALKIPQFGQDLNRGLLERFYREARAAAALRHPGICPVYDVGEIDGQHYITMAYIKGRSLRDFTKSSRRQEGRQVARVIRRIALAMEEAHEHNVIHRDLKPANVMVDLKNEPVVMDFGLARRSVEGEERLTHTGTIIGTPAYMSPEQVDGDNDNVGARSDIYSLGVIFYELLTGQLPFQGNLMSILRQIATAEPRPPVELFPDIDPALQSLCLRMLAKKATDRPASMTEVAQSLTDWLSGRHAPIDESGLLETSRVPGQSRKHSAGEVTEPMTPASAMQAAPATDEFPSADEMSATRQRPRPATRQESPPSNRRWLVLGGLGGAALLLAGIVFFLKLGKHDVQITLDDPAMSLKVDGDAVIIDGSDSPIRLSAGAHELRVELAGFESEVAQFTVKKDGKNAVHVAIVNGKLAVIPDGKAPAIAQTERSAPGSSDTASSKWHSTMEGHSALAFDGVDDHVILPPLPWNGGALTIEALVQAGAQAFPNGMVIAINSERGLSLLSFDTDGVPAFGRMENGTLQATLDSSMKGCAETQSVHIAAAWDGQTASLFLNGRQISRGVTTTCTPRGQYRQQTTIGAILQGAGAETAPMNFLKGTVHELRISSTARYTGDFDPVAGFQPDAGTLALYHFDEGSGDVLQDSSGNNRHGRIVGARWVRTEGRSLTPGKAATPPSAVAPFGEATAKAHQEAWADYLGVPVEYTNSIGMKFRLIPPGEFMMGSTPEEIEAALKVAVDDEVVRERINSEAPRHPVILTQPIYMGVSEVTQSQYEQVMGTNPSHFSATGAGRDAVAGLETGNHPVEMVSWNDAAEFCARLSQQEQLKPFYFRAGDAVTPLDGTGYRLLTEAEWEFACRAGTTTRFWSGDEDHDLVSVGWFGGNSGGRTHAAGELKANPFGLWDMHGNVREWVEDSMDHAFYGKLNKDAATNPSSPFSTGFRRVIRDGNWHHDQSTCRSSRRYANHSSYRDNYIGFRVVLVAESVKQPLSQKAATPPASEATGRSADAPHPAVTPFDAR